ncbi:MAG TPA: diaminopimelate epimerase [Pyrinomonadaceae bacterium]|nr:diaminopimelate epimerase [Pyrinomonadaceae bacterium]
MIKFSKFHGFGNDYVVIEAEQLQAVADVFEFTKRFCHRNLGVGSDGIAILEKLEQPDADFSCRIINPDGSEAGFSGNGTRCAVAYAYYKGLWSGENLRLRMNTGIKNYRLVEEISRGHYWFDAEIGKPKFSSDEVPFLAETKLDSVINQPVIIDKQEFLVSCVNVGNPVACVFVNHFDFDWREVGRKMEVHKKFPARANIVFVKVLDRENIELKIWERGAGETSASGTCSSGAAILSAFRGETGRKVSVHTEGGITKITWREDDEMMILGRADFVFDGEWVE